MSPLFEQDFPIGFAETKTDNNNTEFYVEWLDNSTEFPGLTTNNTNLDGGNWEILRRKEIQEVDEEQTLEEDGDWSKINHDQPLYAQVAEKNAELQPTKRAIQPLWTHSSQKTKVKKEKTEEPEDEEYLAYELNDAHKSQSRRASRLAHLNKLHDLKTVNIHMEGVFRLATSKNGTTADLVWTPVDKENTNFSLLNSLQAEHLKELRVTNKAQALSFFARYSHNTKKYNAVHAGVPSTSHSKQPLFPDNGEYSVHAPIIKY
ncbi:uncharacterized protein B0P05DRAFT_547071 [Gilbertella persicaria]|uniref:uncharacterized protein n=1 Tax=Gilbertella persicaria TaxID=101096 RepID=UPI00221F5F8F|nr:uncharacterized protein B0P05DRAFT_547071 [Gilbertella persicaria]KAI8075951.1 hypothetical protein B0P05DRAFT_547071 [Gilbertella persicaria]